MSFCNFIHTPSILLKNDILKIFYKKINRVVIILEQELLEFQY